MPQRASRQFDAQQETEAEPQQHDENRYEEADAERIARRAYERFQARGGEHGHDQDDWFEAEREVRGSRNE